MTPEPGTPPHDVPAAYDRSGVDLRILAEMKRAGALLRPRVESTLVARSGARWLEHLNRTRDHPAHLDDPRFVFWLAARDARLQAAFPAWLRAIAEELRVLASRAAHNDPALSSGDGDLAAQLANEVGFQLACYRHRERGLGSDPHALAGNAIAWSAAGNDYGTTPMLWWSRSDHLYACGVPPDWLTADAHPDELRHLTARARAEQAALAFRHAGREVIVVTTYRYGGAADVWHVQPGFWDWRLADEQTARATLDHGDAWWTVRAMWKGLAGFRDELLAGMIAANPIALSYIAESGDGELVTTVSKRRLRQLERIASAAGKTA